MGLAGLQKHHSEPLKFVVRLSNTQNMKLKALHNVIAIETIKGATKCDCEKSFPRLCTANDPGRHDDNDADIIDNN